MEFNICRYDAIFLDEISMVSLRNSFVLWESLNSLPIFPLFILCGDPLQLGSFDYSHDSQRTQSFFNNTAILQRADTFVLTQQCRCSDSSYNSFLKDIRYCCACTML